MRLVVVFVWVVASMVLALGQDSAGSLYDEHFPPLHPNCTQSLTDLLLLRQEVQLKDLNQAEHVSQEILKEMVDILTDIKSSMARNLTATPGGRGTLTYQIMCISSLNKNEDFFFFFFFSCHMSMGTFGDLEAACTSSVNTGYTFIRLCPVFTMQTVSPAPATTCIASYECT
ncbi:uncharacterized protein LOC122244615 [Penaeus japonicus]|uniref:uncharacterized protein LOC122244615 n=1 Tax=Penaeus japonicus TaxID=27405 RepID=UPI001C712DA9|nr:uncharacterized protein LOC122244615 [Penaeus japonicus]